MTKLIEFKCDFCGCNGQKKTGHYNYNIRRGIPNYCSKECVYKAKDSKVSAVCSFCGEKIQVLNSVFNASVNKRFFCGHSCSAKYSNSRRKHSEETKNKIASTLDAMWKEKLKDRPPRVKKKRDRSSSKLIVRCSVCDTEFSSYNKKASVCSLKCRTVLQCGTDTFRKDQVVNAILNSYRSKGCSPQRRDMANRLIKDANKFFGSWNKAVKECGLEPNNSKFQKVRVKTADGHMCDSLSERIVDNTLFHNGLIHDRNKLYSQDSRLNCDFYVPEKDLWIEYFGLYGQNEEYDHTVSIKKELAKTLGLKWMFLVPDDLYPENRVIERVESFIKGLQTKEIEV